MSRRRLAMLAAVAVAGGAGAPANAGVPAPTLLGAVPDFVAPGGRLELSVRTPLDGVVRLERPRAGAAAVTVASAPARAGGVATLTMRAPARGPLRLTILQDGGAPLDVRVPVRPVTMVAVGDLSPGSAIAAVRRHGPAWHWERIGPWLRGHDLTVANLETAIGTGGVPWPDKRFRFLAPPSTVVAAARLGGVDVVSLANNHALDYGRVTFMSGIAVLRRAGVVHVGGGADLAAAVRPRVVERGGLRIGFVGADAIEPAAFWAAPGRPGTAPSTAASVRASVRAATARADIVVFIPHWGIEYDPRPTAAQRALADVALRAGADVILGAHPHVPQPVERRGRRMVAWSLGNFVFQPGRPAGSRAIAVEMTFDARGVVSARTRAVRIVDTRPVLAATR